MKQRNQNLRPQCDDNLVLQTPPIGHQKRANTFFLRVPILLGQLTCNLLTFVREERKNAGQVSELRFAISGQTNSLNFSLSFQPFKYISFAKQTLLLFRWADEVDYLIMNVTEWHPNHLDKNQLSWQSVWPIRFDLMTPVRLRVGQQVSWPSLDYEE